MTNTVTSRNIENSSWDIVYNKHELPVEISEKCEFYLRE
jgi:hypothetical protein